MDCLDDNDFLALVAGALKPARLREVEAHLDECAACRQLAAAAAASSQSGLSARSAGAQAGPRAAGAQAGPRAAGAQELGRYSVLKPVGAGAMGVVYAAYDPVLDRRVALKLLHAVGGEADKLRARLLREAQAMARLSHPNVIAVHDVGTVREQVFIAMEFVEGKTLSQWLGEQRADGNGQANWRELLRVFILAGRGLSAAHAAGLVHRDFKPDNVLIGDDGRVRVTDFGLARSAGQDAPDAGTSGARALSSGAGTITEHGALVGSPAYMAPEQLRGETVDARADEFSFTVALYEALYGERPFEGDNLESLRAGIEAGRVRPEPAGTRVPGWLRRVLLRGIASDPDQRFPSLSLLLDALEADPAAKQRRGLVAVATIGVVLSAAALVYWQSGRAERSCQGARTLLQAVWTPELKARARAAFAASGLPYAQSAWELAARALERYGSEWTRVRTEACEATQVRHEQSGDLLDLRMSCLNDRLRELAATAAVFARADAEVVAKSANLAGGLTPLAGCSDARALREPGAPSAEQREKVAALREKLAQVRLLAASGKDEEAPAKELLEQAKKIGYAPLEAEALLETGLASDQAGDRQGAQKIFPLAAAAGLRARVDSIIATGWTQALLMDLDLSKFDDAALAAEQAKAAVSRLGDDAAAQAALARALSEQARRTDHMEEAQAYAEQAVSILEKGGGPPLALVNALSELDFTLQARSRNTEALPVQERAFALAVKEFGPEHPLAGEAEGEVGNLLIALGRNAEGVAHLQHSLAVLRAALGADHPAVAQALVNLGDDALNHRPKEALGYLREALEIMKKRAPTTSTVYAQDLLATALQATGQLEAARAQFEEAIALERRISGREEDLETALAQSSLGLTLIQEGKLAEARAPLEAALRAQDEGFGPNSPASGDTRANLARLFLAEKKFPEARKEAERAVAIAKSASPEPPETTDRQLLVARIEEEQGEAKTALPLLEQLCARPPAPTPEEETFDRDEARFLLARALWETKAGRPRALQLAAQARAGFASRGAPAANQAAEAARWLSGHAL